MLTLQNVKLSTLSVIIQIIFLVTVLESSHYENSTFPHSYQTNTYVQNLRKFNEKIKLFKIHHSTQSTKNIDRK